MKISPEISPQRRRDAKELEKAMMRVPTEHGRTDLRLECGHVVDAVNHKDEYVLYMKCAEGPSV